MPVLSFYGKPACATNRRQKALLRAAGFDLEEVDLLQHPWQREELAAFFSGMPVSEWFNPSAPQLKYGQVDPAALAAAQALDLLLAEPLLIRRPLLQYGDARMAGFDPGRVEHMLGVALVSAADGAGVAMDSCSRPPASEGCR